MYKKNKILITICARGGSKGIPGKNIKKIAGKPLLAYSIESALGCTWVDRIIVSTDDDKIKFVAEKCGIKVPFLRPKKFANDKIGRIAAVVHAVKKAQTFYKEKYDVVIDLGNVSPLRTTQDITSSLDILLKNRRTDVVFSVTEAARNPYYNMVELDKQGYVHLSKKSQKTITSRQMAPPVYDMNDSIYAIRVNSLLRLGNIEAPIQLVSSLKQMMYVMPTERSIDVDTPVDFDFLDFILSNKK